MTRAIDERRSWPVRRRSDCAPQLPSDQASHGPAFPASQGDGRPHADDPVRRRRLRHAAVRAGERALRDARADEFHQPRARRLRHGRRLCDGAPDEPRRRSLPRHPAGRLPRPGDPRRRARAHALPAALRRKPARSGAVHHRPRPHGDADRRFLPRRRAAAGRSAGLAVRQRDVSRRRNQPLSPVHRRRLRRDRRRAAALPGQDALRRATAGGGRRRAGRRRARHRRRPHLRRRLRRRQRARRPRRGARGRRRRRHRSRPFRSSSW